MREREREVKNQAVQGHRSQEGERFKGRGEPQNGKWHEGGCLLQSGVGQEVHGIPVVVKSQKG